jgi:polar amino acid transport system substrate-binding protein
MTNIFKQNRVLVVILVIIAVFSTCLVSCNKNQSTTNGKAISVYDRVIKSGQIRASYADYPPYCIKDPNTGKLSGLMVDVLNEVGKRTGLEVKWTEEVGWGVIFEGLQSDRYDIFGTGVWRNATRGKNGDFSDPIFYNTNNVWCRTNYQLPAGKDGQDFDFINNPNISIAIQDGAMDDLIAKADFPLAKRVAIPQMNPWTDCLMNLKSNKADFAIGEPSVVHEFQAKNPGTIKELFPGKPIRVFSTRYAFKLNEPAFKAMIDSAIEEITNDGTVEKIIKKYEKYPGDLYRVNKPYSITVKR